MVFEIGTLQFELPDLPFDFKNVSRSLVALEHLGPLVPVAGEKAEAKHEAGDHVEHPVQHQ